MSGETLSTDGWGGKVGRGLSWSTAGNIVVRLVNVVSSIVMAWLIVPEQFGVFTVAFTVWVVVSTISEFGLNADLIRAEDPRGRAPTVATLALALGVTVAITMAWSARPVAAAFGNADAASVVQLLAVSAVIMGFATVPSAQMQREFRQATLFVLNLLGAVASTTTIILLASTGVGAASLAWGQIVGQSVLVVGLYLATRTVPRFGLDLDVVRSCLAFCAPLAAANLLSWVVLTADNVIVSRALGLEQLGLYVIAFNISSWPMSALGIALRAVALPAFAQVDRDRRARALVGAVGPVLAVAGLLGLLLGTLAGPTIGLLYPDVWAPAASALSGLAVFGALRVLLDMVATFLIAVGATADVLVVQIVWLAATIPAMTWGVNRFGIAGGGWAHVVVAVAVVTPAYLVCLSRVGVDARDFLIAWVRPLAGMAPAAAACWWIGRLDAPALLLLVLGGSAAAVLYVFPAAPWWWRSVRDLRVSAGQPHNLLIGAET